MDINKLTPVGAINKKHLLSLSGYTEEDICEILLKARELAQKKAVGEKTPALKNRYALLITKRSFSRSRIAFEVAVSMLQGSAIVSTLHGSELETMINDKLSLETLARYGMDAIVVQTSELGDAELIEKSVNIPIINANPKSGPCEALAALYTVWQKKGRLSGLKISFVGDSSAFADSVVYGFVNCGFDVTFVCPEELTPSAEVYGYCRQFGDVKVRTDIVDGIKGADVIFVSDDGLSADYDIDNDMLDAHAPNALVLHTLPVAPDGNLKEDVLSSPRFAGVEEAENLPLIEMAALCLLVVKN